MHILSVLKSNGLTRSSLPMEFKHQLLLWAVIGDRTLLQTKQPSNRFLKFYTHLHKNFQCWKVICIQHQPFTIHWIIANISPSKLISYLASYTYWHPLPIWSSKQLIYSIPKQISNHYISWIIFFELRFSILFYVFMHQHFNTHILTVFITRSGWGFSFGCWSPAQGITRHLWLFHSTRSSTVVLVLCWCYTIVFFLPLWLCLRLQLPI